MKNQQLIEAYQEKLEIQEFMLSCTGNSDLANLKSRKAIDKYTEIIYKLKSN